MKTLIILAMLSFGQKKDSSVVVYRRGLDKVILAKEPIKQYESTPRRMIMYTYRASRIQMINDKKGKIIGYEKQRTDTRRPFAAKPR